MSDSFNIGFLIYPQVTQLDFTGPAQVFAYMDGAKVHVVAASPEPVMSDSGFSIVPTCTLDDCPPLDMVCVPGGPGTNQVMGDSQLLQWLREQAKTVQVLASVCTGSLILGAAGLLKGRRATSHWAARDILSAFGAEPVNARVVFDGNLVTGGGVTAGIDFAFEVVRHLRGDEEVERLRLLLEYDPAPSGAGGTPETARPEIVEALRKRFEKRLAEGREIAARLTLADN